MISNPSCVARESEGSVNHENFEGDFRSALPWTIHGCWYACWLSMVVGWDLSQDCLLMFRWSVETMGCLKNTQNKEGDC